MMNMTLGIYFGLLFIEEKISDRQYSFLSFLLISLFFLDPVLLQNLEKEISAW